MTMPKIRWGQRGDEDGKDEGLFVGVGGGASPPCSPYLALAWIEHELLSLDGGMLVDVRTHLLGIEGHDLG